MKTNRLARTAMASLLFLSLAAGCSTASRSWSSITLAPFPPAERGELAATERAVQDPDEFELTQRPSPGHDKRLGAFLGWSNQSGDSGATVGVEFEQRLDELIGLGASLEFAGGDLDSTLLVIPIYFHFLQDWAFVLAPGLYNRSGELDGMVRFGADYFLHFDGNWVLVPQARLDLVDGEEVFSLGASFGASF